MRSNTCKLFPLQHDLPTTCWCGLAAMSMLSGAPTSHCKQLLRDYLNNVGFRSNEQIKGIYLNDALAILPALGLEHEQVPALPGANTLRQWLQLITDVATDDDVFFVLVKRHFVLVSCGLVYDNFYPNGTKQHHFALDRQFRSAYLVKLPSDF